MLAIFLLQACIIGNGVLATETRDVGSFTRIENDTFLSVSVVIGDLERVTVTCDENILERIETDVVGDTLEIGTNRASIGNTRRCEAEVEAITIEGLELNGSGDLTSAGPLAGLADVALSGSGDIVLSSIDAATLRVDLSGSGDAGLEGDADELVVSLDGSGGINGFDLVATDASVSVSGSGDARLTVTGELEVEIRGSGDVVVEGDPTVTRQDVSGSGDLILR